MIKKLGGIHTEEALRELNSVEVKSEYIEGLEKYVSLAKRIAEDAEDETAKSDSEYMLEVLEEIRNIIEDRML